MSPAMRLSERWAEAGAFWRRTAPRRRMPAGAMAGLAMVAIACLSIGTLSYQAFAPTDVIAQG